MEQTPHIAIVPAPGMGHLIPLVEFAKRLIQLEHYKFSVTLIVPITGPLSKAQASFLTALPSGINSTLLPPVNFDDLTADVRIETRICLTIVRSLSSIRDAVKSLVATTRLVALVVDPFGTDVFDIAREFDVSPYLFFPSSAMCLSFSFYLPELDQKVTCEYRDMPEPVHIPGSISIHGNDFIDPVQDRKNDTYKWILHHTKRCRKNDTYKWILHHTKRCRLADGILVNSYMKLEPETIKALQRPGEPPVYPIGPLVQMGTSSKSDQAATEGSDCLKWLDDQPLGSVLYVSFGSGGTLGYDQLNELAMGLEMSEQRFLWVVRSPNDEAVNATYFSFQKSDPFAFLPKGYLQRINGRGLVVPHWAPQAQILSHGSTGGFLTHCGWNSILESLVTGIPLIAWPLYAEQKMNAIMLTEVLEVALKPEMNENGLIERGEIANVVRSLTEGEEGKQIRNRVRDLKDAAKEELREDGSSTKSLFEVASKWISKLST